MVTVYYVVLVEDRNQQLVSQWARRDEEGPSVMLGQQLELPPFSEEPIKPLVASQVQYDPKRDLLEVDAGAVWLDDLGVTTEGGNINTQLFWSHMNQAGWRPLRPSFVAK